MLEDGMGQRTLGPHNSVGQTIARCPKQYVPEAGDAKCSEIVATASCRTDFFILESGSPPGQSLSWASRRMCFSRAFSSARCLLFRAVTLYALRNLDTERFDMEIVTRNSWYHRTVGWYLLKLRFTLGRLLNGLRVPGVVRDCDYESCLTDAPISVRLREGSTVINANGLDIFFDRLERLSGLVVRLDVACRAKFPNEFPRQALRVLPCLPGAWGLSAPKFAAPSSRPHFPCRHHCVSNSHTR